MFHVLHPPSYIAERRYAMDVLLGDFLGLDYTLQSAQRTDTRVQLEGDSGNQLILADVLFSRPENEWLTPASLPSVPLDWWDLSETPIDVSLVSPSLPVIYGRRLGNGDFLQEHESEVGFGIDILGSGFFMLTRYEELVEHRSDSRDRFPASASLAGREGFLDRPLVNEYLELLWWGFERLWPRAGSRRRRHWFHQHLTHDVDWPLCNHRPLRSVTRSAIGDVVRRRDLRLGLRRGASLFSTRKGNLDADVCNTFDFIMETSERHGLRSAFYFITDNAVGGIEAAPYSIDDPWIRKLLRRIHERGHEIGLHPSYDSFRDPPQLQHEFHNLLRVCEEEGIHQVEWGGRQHYLRWENPITWQSWDDVGLQYDATLSFADLPGFRCGVCLDYPVFNLVTRRPLKLRERPLIVMEATLLGHLNLPLVEVNETLVTLRERCRIVDGQFTLLWHNNQLLSRRQKDLYEKFVGGLTSGRGPVHEGTRSDKSEAKSRR